MTFDLMRKNLVKGSILAVEADPGTRRFYESLLVPEGCHVTAVATWSEAQERLRRESFDLVITDLQPGAGVGADTATAVLAAYPEQELFVVVAAEQSREGVAALGRGATGYLLRPLHDEELRVRINRSLYRSSLRSDQARLTQENIEFRATVAAYHKCMAFLRVRDIDRLGDLVLDTLMELAGAEAGLLWLVGVGDGALRLRCRRGLAQVAAANETLEPDAPEYAMLQHKEPVAPQDGGALFATLRCDGELLGLIKLESPSERKAFAPAEVASAATVAEFAGAALLSLLRLQRSERDLLRTPGGEAYNMGFFRDHLEKELLTAQRYGRHISLIKLVVDNHAELTARFHDQQVAATLREVISVVETVLRDADIISQSAPGVYYMLLPETDAWGALMTQRRIRKAIRSYLLISDMKKNLPVRVVMRSASCPGDGPTLAALDRSMEERLVTLRKSILLRGNFDQLPFWRVADALLDAYPQGASLYEQENGGRYLALTSEQIESLCGAVCREILETHQGRGVALRGCADFETARRAMGLTGGRHERGMTVYLLGGTSRIEMVEPGLAPIHIADPVFSDRTFLLCLGEGYAYAFFARREEERWRAFHTADFYFVENLLSKLQDQYQLQTQI